MSRLLLLLAWGLAAVGCASASDAAAVDEVVGGATPTPTQSPQLTEVVQELSTPFLLADASRWVVIDDWRDPNSPEELHEVDGAQLDVAPLDGDGVPQLGRRVTVGYELGPSSEFEMGWGGASSMGQPVDFVVDGGLGRSVTDDSPGSTISMAVVWTDGVLIRLQSRDPDADLAALGGSFAEVDQLTWVAARNEAEDQRMIAIQAAMETAAPLPDAAEPLPHFVLPEPWELLWVTDKTIWTQEQRAQEAALIAASRPSNEVFGPNGESKVWHYGFADSAEAAAMQLVPDLTVVGFEFETGAETWHPTNYDTISALGLDGVISARSRGVSAELGTGSKRLNIDSRLDEEQIREFLAHAELAGDSPLDGLVVADARYQLIELEDWHARPPSWHASWQGPSGRGTMSLWRMTVPELRIWMLGRGRHLTVPPDVWQTIAERGVVDFGFATIYDVETGLLTSLNNIDAADLIPIALDDWIDRVGPVNVDPVNPR